jgi:hypothetical protein
MSENSQIYEQIQVGIALRMVLMEGSFHLQVIELVLEKKKSGIFMMVTK